MLTPQFLLPGLDYELLVDNFAGGGGASTGIEWATGRPVDHAINHDLRALGMHRINHPQTVHHCEDVFDVDPECVCEGRPVGWAHFSPDCKHFSKAKGGKPLDKRIRGLALVMFRWAKYGCRIMSMENVEEITTWGPLKRIKKKGKWGMYPDPAHMGRTWLAFLDVLSTGLRADHPDIPAILSVVGPSVTREDLIRGFGYQYEARKIRACDYGSPTIRKRLYMIARRDGRPIIWPAETHASPRGPLRGLRPYRIIADQLDWSLPCPSIFLTKRQAKARKIRCKRPLARATLRRVAMGIDRFVLKAEEPFIVSLTHSGHDAQRIHSTREPVNTITGANRGEKALVLSRYHGDHEGRGDGATRNGSLENPLGVQDTSNRYGLAEAALAAAPFITEHANASNQRNMPADEPGRTLCAEVKGGHLALVAGTMVVNTSGHPGAAADQPACALTTGSQQILVAGTMVQTGYGEAPGQAPRALDVEKPLGAVVAGAGKHAAVSGVLVGAGGGEYGGEPRPLDGQAGTLTTSEHAAVAMLKLRGQPHRSPSAPANEPGHTISTARNHGLIAAHLTEFKTGHVGQEAGKPVTTITAGSHQEHTRGGAGGTHGLSAVYLAQHNGGYNETPGHPATEPVSALSAKGSQQQLVAVHAETYYGSGSVGGAADGPARTLRTMESAASVESTITVPPMSFEQIEGARRVAGFLREHGVEFEGEFATVQGLVMVDIGMRMLTPRELFRAQGFGENYVINRAWVVDPETGEVVEVRLTKEQQIRMCGNSVCPQVMAALVSANAPELAVSKPRTLKKLVAGHLIRAA